MTTGADIMRQVGILLNDASHVRWTPPELRDWINDGLKAIVLAKPSAKTATRVLSLAEGVHQVIATVAGDPEPIQLVNVTRNVTATAPVRLYGRAIKPVSVSDLDAADPSWADKVVNRFKKEVRQVIYDEQNPLEFDVYPGNDGTGTVEAVVATLPELVDAPPSPDDAASYTDAIDLPPIYDPILIDYVAYRAQSKDTTDAAPGSSGNSFSRFAQALGLKIQVEGASSINTRRSGK